MNTYGADPTQTTLIRLCGALADRDEDGVERILRFAHEKVPHLIIEEALLQSYLFLGYPVALNALARWRDLVGVDAPQVEDLDREAWRTRGERVCQVVYGGQYERLRENVRSLHPDLERWMVEEGYGKVLGRPGLELVDRELCIVAILAVLGAEAQLYSHLRGALNAGAGPAEVEETLDLVDSWLTEETRKIAHETWRRVMGRYSVGS